MASGNQPRVGATFVPGGFDDYYIPQATQELSVVSPLPQRVTPEVPENIQNNLASLELNSSSARSSPSINSYSQKPSVSPLSVQNGGGGGNFAPRQSHQNSSSRVTSNSSQAPKLDLPDFGGSNLNQDMPNFSSSSSSNPDSYARNHVDMPNFSSFPPITPRPNVPPSDEEKEAILENARKPVLNSNDPDMQLAWAQDVLSYIQISQLYEERMSNIRGSGPRPTTPTVEHQLRVDSMNIVNFLADQHHPKAEFLRGMWYEFGNFGCRVDKKEAFRCYLRAADSGYSRAQYRMGMFFESTGDPVKALTHYKRGADMGDSASNYRLGMMTVVGQMGQQQDFAKGLQMLRAAAETADENAPQGAYVLGMLMARELPQISPPEVLLPYDEQGARINIEKAAYLGFAKAQLKMGAAYELCSLGCDFDPALSLHYNSLAAKQGESEAEMAISKWFLCGYEEIFKKNDELAYVYAERAAHAGLATAEFALGYFNEIGIHVRPDLDKAREWYEKAAEQGNQDALGRVDGLKKDNTLSKEHEKAAIHRIRSQYGSKRGGRPENLRNKAGAPALPSVPDEYKAPYPMDSPNNGGQRSSSAPYPMNDGPPGNYRGPTPVGGFFNPNGNPNQPQHGGRQSQQGSNYPDYNSQNGRPQQQQQRPGPGPQGNSQRFPSNTSQSSFASGQGGRPNQDNIGYNAPMQRPGQSNSPAYGGGRGTPNPHQQQQQQQQQNPGRMSGGNQMGNRAASQPQLGRPGSQQPQQQQQSATRPQRPGANKPGQSGPAGPKPPAAAAAAPPKGPKTFEEMGIQAQKADGDCVVM